MKAAKAGRAADQHRGLIVDDHPVMRFDLRTLISREAYLVVVGEAGGVSEALRLAETLLPDAAVIDLALPDGSGMDLVRCMRALYPSTKLLVCSMYEGSLYAGRVLKVGATGFISKDEASGHVVEAIRRVLAGEIYLSQGMTQRMLRGMHNYLPATVEGLTDRELEVFLLIGKGLKTFQIAKRLHISVKTVDTHCEKLKHKLNLSSATDSVRLAAQWVLEHGWFSQARQTKGDSKNAIFGISLHGKAKTRFLPFFIFNHLS